ncbi:MAG: hypothetical protein D6809_01765 [Gammaproteobacteria bacterium]|nr:MAG: hypothetical protein D6809_01765 [Gammaproteobacteria bacterium]
MLKELEEETGVALRPAPAAPRPPADGNGAGRPGGRGLFSFRRPGRGPAAVAVEEQPVAAPAGSVEERLARLEGRVARLEEELRRERQRLRRLVLLSEELGGWEDA